MLAFCSNLSFSPHRRHSVGIHLLISIIIKYISRLSDYESEDSPNPFKAKLMTYLSDWPGGALSESSPEPADPLHLKFIVKMPVGQADDPHIMMWSVRVSAIHIDHETDRGFLLIVGNWTTHFRNL